MSCRRRLPSLPPPRRWGGKNHPVSQTNPPSVWFLTLGFIHAGDKKNRIKRQHAQTEPRVANHHINTRTLIINSCRQPRGSFFGQSGVHGMITATPKPSLRHYAYCMLLESFFSLSFSFLACKLVFLRCHYYESSTCDIHILLAINEARCPTPCTIIHSARPTYNCTI